MPQLPISMSAARAEKLFNISIVDAPQPKLSVAEVNAQKARPWWARRLRWGWRKNLAALALPAPKDWPS
jgi:hypothetical protein